MSLQERISTALNQIGLDVKDLRNFLGYGIAKIAIWAEENGGLNSNSNEWSFGNGSVGADIGIPLVEDWELYGASFNCDIFNSASITGMQIKNMADDSIIATFNVTSQHTTYIFPEPIFVPKGTVIGFKTGTLSGTITDARVVAWLRQQPIALGIGYLEVS